MLDCGLIRALNTSCFIFVVNNTFKIIKFVQQGHINITLLIFLQCIFDLRIDMVDLRIDRVDLRIERVDRNQNVYEKLDD